MNNLVWFRNDLRIQDQHSLWTASQEKGKTIGLYCIDPRHFAMTSYGFHKTEKFRAAFLLDTLVVLKNELEKHNISLFVFYDQPENILPEFVKKYHISSFFMQKEWTQEEMDVTNAVRKQLPVVNWHETFDQFLFHPEDIPYDFGNIPEVFTQFRKECEKRVSIRKENTIGKQSENNLVKNNTSIPNLSDLGFETFEKDPRTAFPFEGGCVAASLRLQHYFFDTKNLSRYKKTRNGLIGSDYSSKFSPWLAHGSISAKQIYWEVKRYEKLHGANEDTYWLIFELIWRDYFKYISLKHGNKIFQLHGILRDKYPWKSHPKAFEEWTLGKTKESFVNANMNELRLTGFMSNRGRQNVASFWAKEWHQDWRVGAAYFESMLIDYDVHSNYGNWMYNSGVGNDPRDRKFNIQRQAEMYDPHQEYQQLWLEN
jgi:deoxyribodipyrimidine photo-lyase